MVSQNFFFVNFNYLSTQIKSSMKMHEKKIKFLLFRGSTCKEACYTPKRVTSDGVLFYCSVPGHWATQLRAPKKHRSGDKLLATLCPT